ncbi:MAG: sigma-70 family RNA polymerase sigma factor [Chloroflexi bacterium]|nr:sigma-70 family RNA polymerase sigma factor [Chloroflexota bacterium]
MTAGDLADEFAARDELERAFDCLSPEHRALLALRYYADLSHAQIAETLRIPPGTARSRLHYALRNLRAALEAESRQADGRTSRGGN